MRLEHEWFRPEQLKPYFFLYEVVAFAFVTWWIPAYYRTADYRFADEEIEFRRGVFFQKKTTVPYNRITNVDATQGPVERLVSSGSVGIHTAGYGGQMGAELSITGIDDYEAVKDQFLANHRRPRMRLCARADARGRHSTCPGRGRNPQGQDGDCRICGYDCRGRADLRG
jgi:uncharacterized membrane protein YdbT with pleckstrin-like domain